LSSFYKFMYHFLFIVMLFDYHAKAASSFPCLYCAFWNVSFNWKHYLLTYCRALQPMQGLGRLKKTPPSISIPSSDPLIPDPRPLCIIHHSIRPSQVWSSYTSSALRLIQGDFLAWKIILNSCYMSCPPEPGYLNCRNQIGLII
jgi:hypothetical protein